MSTHRVTIELSDEDSGLPRKKVDSGHYAFESEVLADLIPELLLEGLQIRLMSAGSKSGCYPRMTKPRLIQNHCSQKNSSFNSWKSAES